MATMTKRHFQAIANEIKSMVMAAITAADDAALERAKNTAAQFARLCAESNPRFSPERFYAACGLR